MYTFFRRLLGDERGATAVEYGLIITLMVVAAIAGMGAVATKTSSMWNNVSTTVLAH